MVRKIKECDVDNRVGPHKLFVWARQISIGVNPLWRNWLARLTVNQEVGSSSLPGGDALFFSSFV